MNSISGCYLGIDQLDLPFIILGDLFLQHNTVIFDKENSQMGFIDNYKQLTPYMADTNLIYLFDFLQIVFVALVAMFLCCLRPAPTFSEANLYGGSTLRYEMFK